MYKFSYSANSDDIDYDVITKKAMSYIINKRSLTNKYSTLDTFRSYFKSVTSFSTRTDNYKYGVMRYNTYGSETNNRISNISDSTGIFTSWTFKDSHQMNYSTVCNKKVYTATMVNNIYLGKHDNRIYTILSHCVDSDGEGFVAVESFPSDLLYASFSKDRYEMNYKNFKGLYDDRTITIIGTNGNNFTFKPMTVASPVSYSRNIKTSNRAMSVKYIKPDIDVENEFVYDSTKIQKYSFQVLSILYELLPEYVVTDMVDGIVERVFDDTYHMLTIKDLILDMAPQHYDAMVEYSNKKFNSEVLLNDSLMYVSAYVSIQRYTNAFNNSLFFDHEDFTCYVTDDYHKHLCGFNKMPIMSLLSTEGFSDGKLVKMVYDEETETMKFELTTHGREVVERMLDTYDIHKYRKLIEGKMQHITFYMSQDFLKDVIYPVFFDKHNAKNVLKRAMYAEN